MECPICQNELVKYGEAKGKEIYRCNSCGFGETKKLIAQKKEYHRDESYVKEERLFENIFEKRVKIISRFKQKGSVLEIGCSTGLMLSLLMSRGWEVTGIEISRKAAKIAEKRGIKVIIQSFETSEINQKFDLIVLNHTLEHLTDPEEVISKAYSLLNDKGLLYIDVPNFGGLSAKVYGMNWPLLLPEEHLWHFSEKSLSFLLEKLGFRIIFINKSSGIWDYANPMQGVLQSLIHLKKRFFNELITAVPSFLITKLGLGTDLMMIAKKN